MSILSKQALNNCVSLLIGKIEQSRNTALTASIQFANNNTEESREKYYQAKEALREILSELSKIERLDQMEQERL